MVTWVSHRAKGIEPGAVFDAGDRIGVRPRGDFPAFVAEADDLAVAAGADPDLVPGLGAIGRDGEALIARGDQLDRAIEPLGGERDERRCAASSSPWSRKRRRQRD